MTLGEPTLELLAGPVAPLGSQAGAAHGKLQPVGKAHSGEVLGGLSPMGGTLSWKSMRRKKWPPGLLRERR